MNDGWWVKKGYLEENNYPYSDPWSQPDLIHVREVPMKPFVEIPADVPPLVAPDLKLFVISFTDESEDQKILPFEQRRKLNIPAVVENWADAGRVAMRYSNDHPNWKIQSISDGGEFLTL